MRIHIYIHIYGEQLKFWVFVASNACAEIHIEDLHRKWNDDFFVWCREQKPRAHSSRVCMVFGIKSNATGMEWNEAHVHCAQKTHYTTTLQPNKIASAAVLVNKKQTELNWIQRRKKSTKKKGTSKSNQLWTWRKKSQKKAEERRKKRTNAEQHKLLNEKSFAFVWICFCILWMDPDFKCKSRVHYAAIRIDENGFDNIQTIISL